MTGEGDVDWAAQPDGLRLRLRGAKSQTEKKKTKKKQLDTIQSNQISKRQSIQ